MRRRLADASLPLLALGSLIGAAVAGLLAPLARGLFRVPAGGVGWVTVARYPKGFDYFVIIALVAGAMVGGMAAAFIRSRPAETLPGERRSPRWWPVALATFLLMCFIHDHPYSLMDPFHEGEHLTPAFLIKSGERPYRDYFVLHGLAADGGLDALVLGDPPSPRHERRLHTILDAIALALLAPIAAELCATSLGVGAAALASLCAVGAGQVPVFPYGRWIPLLLAALGLLRYARTGRSRALQLAFASSSLGLLWSLDVGAYAVAGTGAAFVLMRIGRLEAKPLSWGRVIGIAALAAAMPLAILLAVRADIPQFFIDSFLTIPGANDSLASLPAPTSLTWETARYYVPPVFYAFLLVVGLRAWARGERRLAAQLVIVGMLSLVIFRTASGRCGWSHLRFAIPLLGAALVAFVVEPLFLSKRRVAGALVAIALLFHVELIPNVIAGGKFLANWRARQRHDGLVAYPFATGKGIYTTPQNAADLATLNSLLDRVASPGAPILDLSNERALYYFLQRKPSVRCPDVAMLSAPPLFDETMAQLTSRPPACVIVEGMPELDQFDGVPNEQRVPWLFAWVDAHYPRRERAGRFVVALRQ